MKNHSINNDNNEAQPLLPQAEPSRFTMDEEDREDITGQVVVERLRRKMDRAADREKELNNNNNDRSNNESQPLLPKAQPPRIAMDQEEDITGQAVVERARWKRECVTYKIQPIMCGIATTSGIAGTGSFAAGVAIGCLQPANPLSMVFSAIGIGAMSVSLLSGAAAVTASPLIPCTYNKVESYQKKFGFQYQDAAHAYNSKKAGESIGLFYQVMASDSFSYNKNYFCIEGNVKRAQREGQKLDLNTKFYEIGSDWRDSHILTPLKDTLLGFNNYLGYAMLLKDNKGEVNKSLQYHLAGKYNLPELSLKQCLYNSGITQQFSTEFQETAMAVLISSDKRFANLTKYNRVIGHSESSAMDYMIMGTLLHTDVKKIHNAALRALKTLRPGDGSEISLEKNPLATQKDARLLVLQHLTVRDAVALNTAVKESCILNQTLHSLKTLSPGDKSEISPEKNPLATQPDARRHVLRYLTVRDAQALNMAVAGSPNSGRGL